MARGAHSLTLCVCVCVRVCTQQCCGDSESERQTGKERQTLHLFFAYMRSLAEALIVPLLKPVLCVREGARAKEASGNGRSQRARERVCVCVRSQRSSSGSI